MQLTLLLLAPAVAHCFLDGTNNLTPRDPPTNGGYYLENNISPLQYGNTTTTGPFTDLRLDLDPSIGSTSVNALPGSLGDIVPRQRSQCPAGYISVRTYLLTYQHGYTKSSCQANPPPTSAATEYGATAQEQPAVRGTTPCPAPRETPAAIRAAQEQDINAVLGRDIPVRVGRRVVRGAKDVHPQEGHVVGIWCVWLGRSAAGVVIVRR